MSPLRITGFGAIVAVVGVAAYWIGQSTAPTQTRTAQPDTIWKERQITKRDTVHETAVRTRKVYDTVRVTDTVHWPVPSGLASGNASIVEPNPLKIQDETATLTRYDVSSQRYVQDVYSLPQPQWTFSPQLTFTAGTRAATATGSLMLGKKADWGAVAIGPASQAIITDRYRLQPAIRLSASLEFEWGTR